MDTAHIKEYPKLALAARRAVLSMVHRAQTSHIASNLSVIDLATVLYDNLKKEDEIVWSKGWAAASIYYFNAKYGRGPQEAVDKFPEEPYFGLAETTVPGVLVNGGSVGHGLPVAAGIALGKKKQGLPGRVYCILSDGELNEGSVWEAAAFAKHHTLDNLVAVVDANGWQAMGRTKEVMNINALAAFVGFGWAACTIDGHNYDQLEGVCLRESAWPQAVIANTVKGKGVSFMENHITFHYKHVTDEDYERALNELV